MKAEDVPGEWWDAALIDYYRTEPHEGVYLAIRAAIAAVAPLIAKAERERCALNLDVNAALSSDPNAKILYSQTASAIRALPDA
jgi:hypothetical protein